MVYETMKLVCTGRSSPTQSRSNRGPGALRVLYKSRYTLYE